MDSRGSHAYMKRFSLSFSYILFSCHRAGSVQILSGFEVNRVVFMCVRASVLVSAWTCEPAEIHACVCVCVCWRVCVCIRAELKFCSTPSFYLLIQYFRMVKLEVYSFGC